MLFSLGGHPVTMAEAAGVAVGLLALLCFLVGVMLVRQSRERSRALAEDAARRDEADLRLRELARVQAETAGRVQGMTELLAQRQSELARAVSERLDATSHRLGETMTTAARATHESLTRLAERLVVMEAAERSLGDLSSQVVALRETLANKQARGAFGQARMEAIVADGLPRGSFAFQHTLSNGRRPDCAIFLPGDSRPLLVDSKFPLEAVTAFREAPTADLRKAAAQRVRADMLKHVHDVAERYLLPGETQDVALIFVPSESVYAEIAERFDAVVQEAYRRRVVLVSPALLMLAVQVVQAIARDARMREAADRVRAEVGALVDDVTRLRERVGDLSRHFSQVSDDVGRVLISADKIARRGMRLGALDFEDGPNAPPPAAPSPA